MDKIHPMNWNLLSLNSRYLSSNNNKVVQDSSISQMKQLIDSELGPEPGNSRTKVLQNLNFDPHNLY